MQQFARTLMRDIQAVRHAIAGFRQHMRGSLALADKFLEPGAFLFAQPHHVLLDGNLFAGHESSPSRDRDGTDSGNAIKRNDVSH
jgi:hypothetical protein